MVLIIAHEVSSDQTLSTRMPLFSTYASRETRTFVGNLPQHSITTECIKPVANETDDQSCLLPPLEVEQPGHTVKTSSPCPQPRVC